MKIVEYRYTVMARVQLSEAEIYHLIYLALLHYDYKCKSAARPGPGAFLNGLKNTIRTDRMADIHLSYDDLDLLNKILESPDAHPGLREAAHHSLLEVSKERDLVGRVMTAVHDQKGFVHAHYSMQGVETLHLVLEEIHEAMSRARQAPTVMDITPDHWIAKGVMAAYMDQCGGDMTGTQLALNEIELRALIAVLQGSPVQDRVKAALARLLAQPPQERL